MNDAGADFGIHWFRRDLRLVGNPALERHLARHPGRVLGVFCFDRKFLARPDFSSARFHFFLRTLRALREELRAAGGDLLVLDVGPDEAFASLFRSLGRSSLGMPRSISWNRDYEPFARERDARMAERFEREYSLHTITERDHLLIEPTELSKEDPKLEGGGFYQVYTPFSKKWLAHFDSPEINARLREVAAGLKKGAPAFSLRWPRPGREFPFGESDLIEMYLAEVAPRLSASLAGGGPPPGHAAAKALLREFRDSALDEYAVGRDIPAVPGTSKMSIYLKNGSITVPQIVCLLKLTPTSPHLKYFKELIWREFYYHILYHRPDVETQPFLAKYRDLPWENDENRFRSWCEGRTGFPIVDAGMRQLNETGWMHNRVRMIVASFLTKDLLIDYRRGERYFMEKLLDGDLAPNNGGWQWAASTGCDPQPYFRIFNPTSQSRKFDPHGEYIRRWVPELRDVSAKAIHEPRSPIVDHAKQRLAALALFKSARAAEPSP